jgi:predicted RNA binding protein YcfA (HicA-like mRNA interferase family)
LGRLKVLSGVEACKILEANGFSQVRQKGSHVIMQKTDGMSKQDTQVIQDWSEDIAFSMSKQDTQVIQDWSEDIAF